MCPARAALASATAAALADDAMPDVAGESKLAARSTHIHSRARELQRGAHTYIHERESRCRRCPRNERAHGKGRGGRGKELILTSDFETLAASARNRLQISISVSSVASAKGLGSVSLAKMS